MPTGLLNADIQFPNTEGKNTKQSIDEITNYLYMLLENLKYSLANLDKDNFNDAGMKEIAEIITKPIAVGLKNANDEITKLSVKAGRIESEVSDTNNNVSRLTQKVDSFRLNVSNGQNSSTIQLTADGTVISSQDIVFHGFVTFTDLQTQGATVINGSNITTGTISAMDINGGTINGTTITGSDLSGGRITSSNIILDAGNGGIVQFIGNNGTIGTLATEDDDRVWLSSNNGAAIKLYSSGGTSIESNENIYIRSNTYLTLRGDRIYLQSDDIYIGNETIESFIRRIVK